MARPAGVPLNRSAWEDVLRMKHLTLTDVAKLAEVNRATVSSFLGGYHRASAAIAYRIAAALEVAPETLFPTLSPTFEAADMAEASA